MAKRIMPGVSGQIIKGYKDVISQPIYDTIDFATGVVDDQVFFANPIGSTLAPGVNKTKWHTNLAAPGTVERGKIFWAYGMSMYFNTTRIIGDDMEAFIGGHPYLSFTLLDKIYYECPVTFVPIFTGFYNIDAISNPDTVTPFNQVKYLALKKKITLKGLENFNVTFHFNSAVTLSKTYSVTFFLHGTMARNIQ